MISKSALSALMGLIKVLTQKVCDEYGDAQRCGCDANAAWDCAREELGKRVAEIQGHLQSLEPTEARAEFPPSGLAPPVAWLIQHGVTGGGDELTFDKDGKVGCGCPKLPLFTYQPASPLPKAEKQEAVATNALINTLRWIYDRLDGAPEYTLTPQEQATTHAQIAAVLEGRESIAARYEAGEFDPSSKLNIAHPAPDSAGKQ